MQPTPTTPRTPTLLTPQQAAETLGVHRRTLYRILSRNGLPAIRLGRLTRIRAADLEKMIDSLPARNGAGRSCRQ